MRSLRIAAATAAVALLAGSAQADIVYSNDFEAGSTTGFTGGGTVQGTQGYGALPGFGQLFLRNDAVANPTTLTLTGLSAHESLDIKFLLGVLDSWDGDPASTNCCKPDYFNVTVDGVLVYQQAFNNFTFSNNPSPTGDPETNLSWGTHLGFSGWVDSAWFLSLSAIPHTSSTATIKFFASGAGFQWGSDESFALDRLTVSSTAAAVPEPSSVMLLGLGLAAAAFARRRR